MHRVIGSVLVLIAIAGCNVDKLKAKVDGEYPQYQCTQMLTSMCRKLHECAAADFDTTFGSGEDGIIACRVLMRSVASGNNDSLSCDQNNPCPTGEVWHEDRAEKCLKSLETLSCTEFNNDDLIPACELVCE
jgi:hypothetical protein